LLQAFSSRGRVTTRFDDEFDDASSQDFSETSYSSYSDSSEYDSWEGSQEADSSSPVAARHRLGAQSINPNDWSQASPAHTHT
jgi:hypothetical protein